MLFQLIATISSLEGIYSFGIMLQEPNGIKHWTDGNNGECRGLSGVPIQSLMFVDQPGSLTVISDSASQQYTVTFFSDYNCAPNSKMGDQTGNNNQLCTAGSLNGNGCVKPYSVLFKITGSPFSGINFPTMPPVQPTFPPIIPTIPPIIPTIPVPPIIPTVPPIIPTNIPPVVPTNTPIQPTIPVIPTIFPPIPSPSPVLPTATNNIPISIITLPTTSNSPQTTISLSPNTPTPQPINTNPTNIFAFTPIPNAPASNPSTQAPKLRSSASKLEISNVFALMFSLVFYV